MIVNDYTKHKVKVESIVNAHVKAPADFLDDTQDGDGPRIDGKPVTLYHVERLVSDNEGAFLDVDMKLFNKDKTRDNISMSHLFVVSREHVSYIERMIRTIKERAASVRAGLHFQIKDRLLDWLIAHAVMWINGLYTKTCSLKCLAEYG